MIPLQFRNKLLYFMAIWALINIFLVTHPSAMLLYRMSFG